MVKRLASGSPSSICVSTVEAVLPKESLVSASRTVWRSGLYQVSLV